ncbi:MAG TPA: hypothetical protein VK689_09660 [Armatimonadota bacterium]|nr:hypothetical protein [Armatimonadota bacterium]
MPPYPLVEFVLSVGAWDFAGEALPDTGCEVGIVIPKGVGIEIDADPGSRLVKFADGRERYAPSWPAVVELEGRRFSVEAVAVGEGFLMGRELLDQLEICFEFGRNLRLRFQNEEQC